MSVDKAFSENSFADMRRSLGSALELLSLSANDGRESTEPFSPFTESVPHVAFIEAFCVPSPRTLRERNMEVPRSAANESPSALFPAYGE